MSEDAYKGDAQFVIEVDGKQIGEAQSVTALHSQDQSEVFTIKGDFGPGPHEIDVSFINDLWDGTPALDRNLYIDGIAFNGSQIGNAATLLKDETMAFGTAPAVVPPGAVSPATPLTVGSGPDTLILNLSEDAYKGDAQFTLTVDGKPVDTAQSVTALHGEGQSEAFTIKGDWGAGPHQFGVSFINDLWDGPAPADRNLYIDSATFNGGRVENAVALRTDSTVLFGSAAFAQASAQAATAATSVPASGSPGTGGPMVPSNPSVPGQAVPGDVLPIVSNPTPPGSSAPSNTLPADLVPGVYGSSYPGQGGPDVPPTVGTGPDSVTLDLSEDADAGDAQFTFTVDGQQVGPTQSVTALHGKNPSEQFTFRGDWGSGTRQFGVAFVNGAPDGSTGANRHLYLDSAGFDTNLVANATEVASGTPVTFGTAAIAGPPGQPIGVSAPAANQGTPPGTGGLMVPPATSEGSATAAASTPGDSTSSSGSGGSTIPNGLRLTFDDEFNSFSSSPDGSSGTWTTTYPFGGAAARTLPANHEAEYYSDPSVGENPFSVNNGALTISATPAAAGSNPAGLPYDSGVITTQNSFAQQYGYFEMRAQLPAGAGLWPAFWMIPKDGSFSAELDVLEQLGNDPKTIYATVHDWAGGDAGTGQKVLSVPDASTGFHTYGVDWEPDTTTFYEDGQAVGSVATPASMQTPMIMMANLAVGGAGSWPGAPDGSTKFPANMQIDYIRAYATANTTKVSGRAALANGGTAPPPALSNPPPAAPTPPAPSTPPDPAGPSTGTMTVTDNNGSSATVALISTGSHTDHPSSTSTVTQTVSNGADTLKVAGTVKGETATLGAGPQKLILVNPRSMVLTAGSGIDTVTADSGNNQFVAGAGSLTVTGGSDATSYVLHAGSGQMAITDFDPSKGDTLKIDKALQGALKQASDGHGGTMLTFGIGQGSVDLINHTTLNQSSIAFI